MSDENNFLARWSRRKRGTAREAREQLKPANEGGDVASGASVSSSETKPPFDPASLPPIESIGAGSDIRAFLAAGVPADLTRAALRRVWQSDPKIRDFIGLSENSWDFNAPGAMAGFGPIDKEEAGRLLTQLLGEPDATATAAHSSTIPAQSDKAGTPARASAPVEEVQFTAEATGPALAVDQRQFDCAETADYVTQGPKTRTASQVVSASSSHRAPRGHGGALPK